MQFSNVLWTLIVILIFYKQVYYLLANFLRVLSHTYFRRIDVHGINNIPREGPVIVCANHPNMVVDPLLVITELVKNGRTPYAWAKGSLFTNPFLAMLMKSIGAVPVYRPRKESGSLEDIDSKKTPEEIAEANNKMFEHTWNKLAEGQVMLLFPEGTSYTAPKMLKLRTGVIRVATGFVKKHDQTIPIIPVGITYFNKDRFRSQVVLEFGTPLIITPEDVHTKNFQENEHQEVKRFTEMLENKMHDLTLNASDFKTLKVARIMRRLFLNTKIAIESNKEVRLTQQIINLLEEEENKKNQNQNENENDTKTKKIQQIKEKVIQYKEHLDCLRLKDQDLLLNIPKNSLVQVFIERLCYLLVLVPLALPGLALNFPFYFIGTKLNDIAGFTESKSMFKMFAAAVLVPAQWFFLILVTLFVFGSDYAYALSIGLPVFLYSHIRVLEESRSILENFRFLFNIAAHNDQVAAMVEERKRLTKQVHEIVSEYMDPHILKAINKAKSRSSPQPTTLRHRVMSTGDHFSL